MEVTSFLSLNDDCLRQIVASITDPSTFYSLSLTCKRLRQLTSDTTNWHINIFRSKAEYFIKHLAVVLSVGFNKNHCTQNDFDKFQKLVDEAVRCSSTRSFLTYNKVADVWNTSGPVVSELLKWIRSHKSIVRNQGNMRFTEKSFVLHLPKLNRKVTFTTYYQHNYKGYTDDEFHFIVMDEDFTMDIRRKIVVKEFKTVVPDAFKDWSDEEVQRITKKLLKTMKPVIKLLQEELGDTFPPVNVHFLFWFLYFFPVEMSLKAKDKLMFKDAVKNEKPDIESTQPVLKDIQDNLLRNFQTVSAKWLDRQLTFTKKIGQASKSVVESLDALVQRSDVLLLQKVQDYLYRIFQIIADSYFKEIPEKQMILMIERTSFQTTAANYMHVENTVSFKLQAGKVIKVRGEMQYVRDGNPNSDEALVTDFHLPDCKPIHVQLLEVAFNTSNPAREERNRNEIGQLSPVTRLLQECINHDMLGEEKIPEITNVFTAAYFLAVLGCQNAHFSYYLGI